MNTSQTQRERRKKRIREHIRGTKEKPRLTVFRSNDHMYVQIIDDAQGKTILGITEKKLGKIEGSKTEKAKALGMALAKEATNKKIHVVIFDKGPYKYHGRLKALAEGAREGGLVF